MKKMRSYLPFILIIFTFWQSNAQEQQNNAWKALFTDFSLTNSKTLRLETHLRTRQFFWRKRSVFTSPFSTF
jgi:hypothetical protein